MAPMAAKLIWHRHSCPAHPTSGTSDRAMRREAGAPRHAARHRPASARQLTARRTDDDGRRQQRAPAATRCAAHSTRRRVPWARRRVDGSASSTMNSTTTGIAGRKFERYGVRRVGRYPTP